MKRNIGLLFLLLGALPSASTGQLSPAAADRIDRLAAGARERLDLPGLSVAVVVDGQLAHERGFGLADVEQGVTASAATVYPIASITKSVTAVAAFQLVDEGRLELDAPVQRWVPSFPEASAPMTMRHLLWHTSGIRHYRTEANDDAEYANRTHYPSLEAAVGAFARDSLMHPPGAGVTYSSFAYTLAGRVLEVAAGASFMEVVQSRILEPAAMRHTRAHDPRAIVPLRARGYVRVDGELRNAEFVDPSNRLPGGGLLSTVGDLARFASALMDGRLLSPAAFDAMTDSLRIGGGAHPLAAGWAIGTGNWLPERAPFANVLWNGGNIHGATSVLYLVPERRFAVVVATNVQDHGTDMLRLADDIARAALGAPEITSSAGAP
ncbi:MAG TPA: serine hydrolase domain-containing protein [Longimicrobiales bacterium]